MHHPSVLRASLVIFIGTTTVVVRLVQGHTQQTAHVQVPTFTFHHRPTTQHLHGRRQRLGVDDATTHVSILMLKHRTLVGRMGRMGRMGRGCRDQGRGGTHHRRRVKIMLAGRGATGKSFFFFFKRQRVVERRSKLVVQKCHEKIPQMVVQVRQATFGDHVFQQAARVYKVFVEKHTLFPNRFGKGVCHGKIAIVGVRGQHKWVKRDVVLVLLKRENHSMLKHVGQDYLGVFQQSKDRPFVAGSARRIGGALERPIVGFQHVTHIWQIQTTCGKVMVDGIVHSFRFKTGVVHQQTGAHRGHGGDRISLTAFRWSEKQQWFKQWF